MPLMRLRDIDKSYGTVHALKDVSLDLAAGRVHALVGDNGAGKSTLVKIISGALQPDHGEIFLNDTPVHFSSPSDALNRGIATVFQDLALIPTRDVAHNMFVGNELRRWGILVDHRRMAREAHAVLKGLHIHNMPSVKELVSRLSGGQRQAVAIGRAVHEGRSLLVLDEPTAALGVRESHQVLSLIARLRDQGMAVSSTLGARAFTRVAADPACGPVTEQGVAWPKRACRFPPRQQEYVWVAANIADPFYAIGHAAWTTAGKTLGVKVSLVGPQTADVSQQVSIMRQLIAKPTTAGILMYAIDYHALQPVMIRARKAGIPVIDGNGDWTNHAVRDAFVGTANQALGSSAADLVGKLLNGKGNVGIVSLITAQNHQERVAGFKAEIKAKFPNIKILGIAAEDGTPTVEQKAAGAFLSAHPNVNLLWTTDAGSAYVATQVKQQGLAGKVKLVGTDRSPAEIAGICSGEVYATITQDTYSEEYTALNYLFWLYNKKATVPDSTITKPAIVTKQNAHC